MTFCDVPQIRISDPGDLIETVPYLIGFHPVESLVLIGFTDPEGAGRPQRVQVTMRVDLPQSPVDAEVFEPLVESLRHAEATSAAVVVLTHCTGDPRDSGELQALAAAVSTVLRAAAIMVLDVLVASDEHWWSLCCDKPSCCPPEGTRRALGCSPSAAQATFAGLVALPDRAAVSATLAGLSPDERAAVEPDLAEAEHRVARAALAHGLGRLRKSDTAAFRRAAERARQRARTDEPAPDEPALDEPAPDRSAAEGIAPGTSSAVAPSAATPGRRRTTVRPLSHKQLARFGVALSDLGVRDAMWLAIDDQSLDATELLHELHTRLPAPYDAAPLFLYGWAQWRAGNGTLAVMAAERALESDPNYSAALLLVTAVQRGMDPRSTPALREPDLLGAQQ